MKTIIIGSGRIENYTLLQHYLSGAERILCADGGTRHCRKFGVKPDVIIGDLDSSDDPDLAFFREVGVPFEKFPVEKDMTDLELCLDRVTEPGEVVLLGASGGRADHYMANVLLLANYVDRGMELLIADEKNEIGILSGNGKKKIELKGSSNDYISLLPLTEKVEGVTTKGLKYELTEHTLFFGRTFSVSNCILEKRAEVTIREGKLLVIKSRD